jgi:signal transduction histidine kinase
LQQYQPTSAKIVISGKGDKLEVIRALQLGADDYLEKPFRPEELAAALAQGLEKCHAREEALQRQRELVTVRRQLERSQRMESMGLLASGIAHDFNNILAIVLGSAALARRSPAASELLARSLDRIEQSAARGAELARRLLNYARLKPRQTEVLNLNHLVKEVAKLLQETLDRRISVAVDGDPELAPIRADVGQIHQVLMNLCLNARDAMPQGGTLTLTTRNVAVIAPEDSPAPGLTPGTYVMLQVRDTGEGIEKPLQERIFEPFFTTKGDQQGTGLGLAVASFIICDHGGAITVDSAPQQGACFTVYLPAQAPETPVAARPREEFKQVGGTETVLVVDDEADIREIAREVLEEAGYTVLVAADGAEAVRLYEVHRPRIDLVLLDLIMPNLSGAEALHRLRSLNPAARVIFISGYNRPGGTALDDESLPVGFIQKPFRLEHLLQAVREKLDT